LTDHGGDIHTPASNYGGLTALQAACKGNKMEVVRYLLEKGANINAPPAARDGFTVLEASLAAKDTAMFRFLLEQGASIGQPQGHSSHILRLLIDQMLFNLVPLALDASANVNEISKWGRNALQGAAIQGHVKIVLLLLEGGGKSQRPPCTANGRTVLEGAAEHGRLDTVKLLLVAGAEP
ncbi:ankyrin repeat-containing domain protein, partial [Podospora didyma]